MRVDSQQTAVHTANSWLCMLCTTINYEASLMRRHYCSCFLIVCIELAGSKEDEEDLNRHKQTA